MAPSFIELEEKYGARPGDILICRRTVMRGGTCSREPFAGERTNWWQIVEGDPKETDYDDLCVRNVHEDDTLGDIRLVKTTEVLWGDVVIRDGEVLGEHEKVIVRGLRGRPPRRE